MPATKIGKRRWYHSFPTLGIEGERVGQEWVSSLLPTAFLGTVLDIGTASGYFAFLAALRGAKKVFAIDVPDVEADTRQQFMEIQKTLGLQDKVSYRSCSVYELGGDEKYDTVLFLGVFYHLRHPALALDKIAEVCKEVCYLETRYLEGASGSVLHYAAGAGEGSVPERDSPLNWWYVPSLGCLQKMCGDSGFSVEWQHIYDGRAMLKLKRIS